MPPAVPYGASLIACFLGRLLSSAEPGVAASTAWLAVLETGTAGVAAAAGAGCEAEQPEPSTAKRKQPKRELALRLVMSFIQRGRAAPNVSDLEPRISIRN